MKRTSLLWWDRQKNHGIQEFLSGKRSVRSGDQEFRNTNKSPQGRKRKEMTAKLVTRL